MPITEKPKRINNGIGAGHSLTIGATMVIDLAIMPQVPTDVFLLFEGKILSSVKLTWVVTMKLMMMPILSTKISTGIRFSSNLSLNSWFSKLNVFV